MPKQSTRPTKIHCRLCDASCTPLGSKDSLLRGKTYHYQACDNCGFFFISDPWTDYPKIYDAAYYRGQGGDPGIDYAFELAHAQHSVRRIEYQGLLELARHLKGGDPLRWLDYGCGHGGLVNYVRERTDITMHGFEEGVIATQARAQGVPILTRQALSKQPRYDLVSAIEVLEHCPDPLRLLRQVRHLLKPSGVLLLTTGNAEPHKKNLLNWSYASAPDVHVSFFHPKTLALAYRKAGLTPFDAGYAPGVTKIIQYKVLKAMRVKKDSAWFRLLPWWLIAWVVDRAYRVSAMPMAMLSVNTRKKYLIG